MAALARGGMAAHQAGMGPATQAGAQTGNGDNPQGEKYESD